VTLKWTLKVLQGQRSWCTFINWAMENIFVYRHSGPRSNLCTLGLVSNGHWCSTGCVLSPLLFCIFLEVVMARALERKTRSDNLGKHDQQLEVRWWHWTDRGKSCRSADTGRQNGEGKQSIWINSQYSKDRGSMHTTRKPAMQTNIHGVTLKQSVTLFTWVGRCLTQLTPVQTLKDGSV